MHVHVLPYNGIKQTHLNSEKKLPWLKREKIRERKERDVVYSHVIYIKR